MLSDYNTLTEENQHPEMSFREYLNKTFLVIAGGLLISSIVAFLVSSNFVRILVTFGVDNFYYFTLAMMVLELGVAFYFSFRLMKMSKVSAYVCYGIYSLLTGFTLGIVLEAYTSASVLMALASTMVLFICMAIIGHTTEIDLTKFGSLFMVGLIVLIITSALNIFLIHSTMLELVLTYAGVIIFLGLIAYDMQKLRYFYECSFEDVDMK